MRDNVRHYGHRLGWLRATVLGANDGIVSTACLLLGVAAANASRSTLLTAGMAGLVAGAVSMAVGEYVSVASQRDSERSDIAKEQWELEHQSDFEFDELASIYQSKGLTPALARDVARQLTAHDALEAHLRDELGMSQEQLARPVLAAFSSAGAFLIGGGVALAAAAMSSFSARIGVIVAVALVALVGLGFAGAYVGGARPGRPIARVLVGGVAAMVLTMAVGKLFGAAVS